MAGALTATLDALPTSNRRALTCSKETLSYAELDVATACAAGALIDEGLQPGDRVVLLGPKSVDHVVALLGVLRAGATYVPLHPQMPVEAVIDIARRTEARLIVTTTRLRDAIGQRGLDNVRDFSQLKGPPKPSRSQPETVAYIFHTSGTTGTPKSVPFTHQQALAFVEDARTAFGVADTDVIAAHASFAFDLSIFDLFVSLHAGAETVLIPESTTAFPRAAAQCIADHGISIWNSVPSALIDMVKRGALADTNTSTLRLVLFAGEPYPRPALSALHAAAPSAQLINVYGQTEANSSCMQLVDPADPGATPIGRAFGRYRAELLDTEGHAILAPHVAGELEISGPAVSSGYPNEEGKQRFREVDGGNAYLTGDLAQWDAHGRLLLLGRADRMVKVRGFRVNLAEVEQVARAVVADAVAVYTPADGIVIHFVGDEATLQSHLQTRLAPYMRPARMQRIDAIPRNANGKLDRQALLNAHAEVENHPR